MSASKILISKTSKDEFNDEIDVTKSIYFTCSCDDLGHIGRVYFYLSLLRKDKKIAVTYNNVTFQFNAEQWIYTVLDDRFPKNSIKRWLFIKWMRIKNAIKLLFGIPIYFESNVQLDLNSSEELAKAILDTTKLLKDEYDIK